MFSISSNLSKEQWRLRCCRPYHTLSLWICLVFLLTTMMMMMVQQCDARPDNIEAQQNFGKYDTSESASSAADDHVSSHFLSYTILFKFLVFLFVYIVNNSLYQDACSVLILYFSPFGLNGQNRNLIFSKLENRNEQNEKDHKILFFMITE